MGDYCGELFAEGGGYFVVIGDLFAVECYWLVGGNALFLAGHLGNEPVKTSGVLCSFAGLYLFPPILSIVFGYGLGYLSVKGLDYGVTGVLLSSLIPLLDEVFGYFWEIVGWFSHVGWFSLLGGRGGRSPPPISKNL